jgi:hypothetical protein
MLQKIRGARQDNASRERQWFQDDYFDLFFWTDAAGKVLAFQLCYDRLRHERVLAGARSAVSSTAASTMANRHRSRT